MRRIVFLPKGRKDLNDIWQWYAKNDIAVADRMDALLHQGVEHLAEFPHLGHRRSEVRDMSYLFWIIHPYVIAYKYDDDQLTVFRILHGARDFTKHF